MRPTLAQKRPPSATVRQMQPMHVLIFVLILMVVSIVRLPVLLFHPFYSSDTAIVDLMARHLLHGEFRFYYWAEHYYGALDWVLLAALFKTFGQKILVSESIPFVAAITFIALTHVYLRRTCGVWIAHGASLLLAVPSVSFLWFTTGTYNYSFGVCLGVTQLLLALDVTRSLRRAFWFGICVGFSYYYFHFIMIFSAGLLLHLWIRTRAPSDVSQLKAILRQFSWDSFFQKQILRKGIPENGVLKGVIAIVTVSGLLILVASIPLWLHGNVEGVPAYPHLKISFWHTCSLGIHLILVSQALSYRRQIFSSAKSLWQRPTVKPMAIGFIIGYIPGILGDLFGQFPSSPGSKLLSLPVEIENFRIFFAQILPAMTDFGVGRWSSVMIRAVNFAALVYIVGHPMILYRRLQRGQDTATLLSEGQFSPLIFVGFAGLLLGLFGIELTDLGSGRYFLPVMIALPLAVMCLLNALSKYSKIAAILIYVLWIGNSAFAKYQYVRSLPQTDIEEEISHRLIERGYKAGYADYWIAYRLTAISHESIVVAPTGDNDRYRKYLRQAQDQRETFLVGDNALPIAGTLQIKGVQYAIESQERYGEKVIDYLQRLAPTPPSLR